LTAVPEFLLSPAVTLAVFLAVIYTMAVHLFMGLGFRRLLRHWILALAGMTTGATLAVRAGSHLPTLADAHVLEGSALAIAVLLAAGFQARHAAPQSSPSAR
jgi:hypothetical protein